jgi:hypothetical protein
MNGTKRGRTEVYEGNFPAEIFIRRDKVTSSEQLMIKKA